MSDPLFEGDDDANTPLEPEEREQLIPSYITLRSELNEAELANIADAQRWLSTRKRTALDPGLVIELHKRMFGDVWKWAGTFRTTARNIGIDAHRIAAELYHAIDDARFRVTNETFPPDEIAIRLSHRIVAIHPFPNGNGRLSRLVGDMLAIELGRARFSWGRIGLVDPAATRRAYIAALKAGDAGDFGPLMAFARS